MSGFDPELYALRPWYHDFSALGFDTSFLQIPLTFRERLARAGQVATYQIGRLSRTTSTDPVPGERARSVREIFGRRPSSHLLNQPVKEKHLLQLIGRALSELHARPSCLELFSADGYYSCRVKALSAEARITGVDLDARHIQRARTIARRLGFEDVVFVQHDVGDFLDRSEASFELILCAGGLYHLDDPLRLLERIGRVAARFVVIQTAVTLETEDASYFVQPAPGWQHGCRFSHAWLRARLGEMNWSVVDEVRDELPGNRRLRDRGSSFFLCRV